MTAQAIRLLLAEWQKFCERGALRTDRRYRCPRYCIFWQFAHAMRPQTFFRCCLRYRSVDVSTCCLVRWLCCSLTGAYSQACMILLFTCYLRWWYNLCICCSMHTSCLFSSVVDYCLLFRHVISQTTLLSTFKLRHRGRALLPQHLIFIVATTTLAALCLVCLLTALH